MKASPFLVLNLAMISLSLPACHRLHGGEHHQEEHHKLVVTSPVAKDIVVSHQFVCQIRSRRHIEVRALQEGYLEAISVAEGQAVKKGDVLFKVVPLLYKARWDAEVADLNLAQIEYDQTCKLASAQPPVVSKTEVAIYQAKLAKAQAKLKLAEVELKFTEIKATFDGIIDRLMQQEGSLVKKEDLLTTLSDNSVMWVYFNVPEARYYEFKELAGESPDPSRLELVDSRIELKRADGKILDQGTSNVVTVEGVVHSETGNFKFRSDYQNPGLGLRHGQTGTVLVHRTLHNAIVIPQRATFELLDKRYVYVVGEDHVVHQRLITIKNELDDIFVIKSGLGVNDKIILEGVRQVHDGDKVEYEFRKPEAALENQKFHAE